MREFSEKAAVAVATKELLNFTVDVLKGEGIISDDSLISGVISRVVQSLMVLIVYLVVGSMVCIGSMCRFQLNKL